MTAHRHLIVTRVPLPTPQELAAWKCEAIHQGFTGHGVVLRLCWARWYWRVVQGYGPERRTG